MRGDQMIKYREILRLRAKGVSMRNIAYSVSCARSTVQRVIRHADGRGLAWLLPENLDDKEIYSILFEPAQVTCAKVEPDFERVNRELLRDGVTLMLLWQEYCADCVSTGTEPYQYSAFCHRYRTWADSRHIVSHLNHRPAGVVMVDWAGKTMQTVDRDTGETHKVYIFVACLPYSSYLYAQGFYSMDSEAWLSAHIGAFEYFGGTTPILIPDNLKTGVIKNTSSKLVINESYRRMAEYYGIAVIPARPRKPQDKAAVEMGVNVITRSAIAPLRNLTFFDLGDLNAALAGKVADINARTFQKRQGSRESIFNESEKDALIPLPAKRFEVYTIKTVRVPYNYHISACSLFYSVPYTYVKQEVEVRIAKSTISIFSGGVRVAMHKRSYARAGTYITDSSHMPDTHRDYAQWNGNRFRTWAAQIGSATKTVTDFILASRPIEQQSYRSARALLALGEKHGNADLEKACVQALEISGRPSYKTVSMLMAASVASSAKTPDDNAHAYLRGAHYYDNDSKGGQTCGQ